MTLNTYVFISISWRILLEELHKSLQFLFLLLSEVAVYKNNTPIWKATHTLTVLPQTDIESYGLNVYTYTTTVLCRCKVKTISITEPLAKIEVEIQ